MAIEAKTRTTYHVTCDRCGAMAPGSPVREEAIFQAIESGWQCVSWWNGLKDVHWEFCPDCFEECEAEQGQGWEEAKEQPALEGLEQGEGEGGERP